MRILAVSASLLAVLICSGCAQMRSGTAMGAGAANTVQCRDGAWTSNTSQCSSHGGVEKVVSKPSQ